MGRIRAFEVGGSIRDEFLGLKSGDRDFSVEAPSYEAMKDYIVNVLGGDIKKETPECLTVKALVDHSPMDFVMCRTDGVYKDGSRKPENVSVGSVWDDLARRDFRVNAIARDLETGEFLDPYNGREDIALRLIRCVGRTEDRIMEDAVRLLRAVRIAITKELSIDGEIMRMFSDPFWTSMLDEIHENRVRDELFKMFKHDTLESMRFFTDYPLMRDACFSNNIWLKVTLEKN